MIAWRSHLQVQAVSDQAASGSGISVGTNWDLISLRTAKLPLAIGAAYFQHGVGCRPPNTERFLGLVQALRGARAKAFIGFGDWNIEPVLFDQSWLAYAGLATRSHAPEGGGASTCKTTGGLRLYDYFLVCPVASALLGDIGLVADSPWAPHVGVCAEVRTAASASQSRAREPCWKLAASGSLACGPDPWSLGGEEHGEQAQLEAWLAGLQAAPQVPGPDELTEESPCATVRQAWGSWNRAAETAVCRLRDVPVPPSHRPSRGFVGGVRLRLSESHHGSPSAMLSPLELGTLMFESVLQAFVHTRHA